MRARLLAVTNEGKWETWLIYFLRGVRIQAEDALARIQHIDNLVVRWREQLAGFRPGAQSKFWDCLSKTPSGP